MSLKLTSDTGAYETFAKTLSALFSRDWNSADTNINNPKPTFFYDEDRPTQQNKYSNAESVTCRSLTTSERPDRTSLDHIIIGEQEFVEITIHAATEELGKRYEREIKRILRKRRPSATGTPIKKSDNSSNSAIHDYDQVLPSFIPFSEGDEKDSSWKSSAILTVLYEYQYVP